MILHNVAWEWRCACDNTGAKNGPGNRAANSARGLTPEVESEALMSMTPHPCDNHQGVRG